MHSIAQAARNGWTLGVMFIDLDRFKEINDSMGHNAGDTLLKQVGARLIECVRGEDTISRLSGDEFAVWYSRIWVTTTTAASSPRRYSTA